MANDSNDHAYEVSLLQQQLGINFDREQANACKSLNATQVRASRLSGVLPTAMVEELSQPKTA